MGAIRMSTPTEADVKELRHAWITAVEVEDDAEDAWQAAADAGDAYEYATGCPPDTADEEATHKVWADASERVLSCRDAYFAARKARRYAIT
jgi:hypothetical protein